MTTIDFAQKQYSAQWCYVPINRSADSAFNPQPQANTWVRLLDILNPFCHDEALLLCQESDSEWVAWIPDHGEASLRVWQFCVNPFN